MSGDDSGFDKEAEREKLREKYGDEDESRENARRMSELLLQGATMTGKHCNECGDPIFRYDGQEFCATCQHEAAQNQSADRADVRSAEADPDADTDSDPTADPPASNDAGTDSDAAEAPAGDASDDEPRVEINGVRVADRHASGSDQRRSPSQRDADGSHRGKARDRNVREPHAHRRTGETADDGSAGDLGEARAALVRKLTDLARRAEATDDVARTRELLSATREAADALAALDDADR